MKTLAAFPKLLPRKSVQINKRSQKVLVGTLGKTRGCHNKESECQDSDRKQLRSIWESRVA